MVCLFIIRSYGLNFLFAVVCEAVVVCLSAYDYVVAAVCICTSICVVSAIQGYEDMKIFGFRPVLSDLCSIFWFYVQNWGLVKTQVKWLLAGRLPFGYVWTVKDIRAQTVPSCIFFNTCRVVKFWSKKVKTKVTVHIFEIRRTESHAYFKLSFVLIPS